MNPDPVTPPTARDYLRILARRWWVVVATIVALTLAGVVYSNRGPTIYKSSTEVRFRSGASSVDINTSNKANTGTADRDLLTEVEVIKARRFKNNIIDRLKLQPKAIKQVNVSNVLNTNVIKITIGTAHKDLSVTVADAYATTYLAAVEADQATQTKEKSASILKLLNDSQKKVTALQTALSAEAKRVDTQDTAAIAAGLNPPGRSARLDDLTSQLNTIEPVYTTLQQQYNEFVVSNAAAQATVRQIADAVPATQRSQPQPVKDGLVGFVLGLVLGIVAAFVSELLGDKVRSRQDVERFSRLPVLATVPRRGQRGATGQPVALTNPASPAAEAYRAARAGVQFLSMQAPMRRILVTGLTPKDRQDVAAANLAVTLAASGARVVLVDADLRGGKLHERFGLTRGAGLTAVLLDETPLTEALRPVEVPAGALRVLTTGALPPNPADLVASEPLAAVLAQLAEGADYVVVSSPPLLPFNDTLSLARHSDGVILVATAKSSRRRQLADGAAKLQRVGAPAVGVVLDRGSRGADAYEATVGRIHLGDAHRDDAPPTPAPAAS
ncbi:MAG: tyrosine-protein kinase [Actinomycetota bacterium]|nr:tyrosine-protein kinase [Actinomycetota bacterium]